MLPRSQRVIKSPMNNTGISPMKKQNKFNAKNSNRKSNKKDDGISSAENPEKDELKSPTRRLCPFEEQEKERREKIKREILVLILAKLEDFAPISSS